jgi:hypothetical protein
VLACGQADATLGIRHCNNGASQPGRRKGGARLILVRSMYKKAFEALLRRQRRPSRITLVRHCLCVCVCVLLNSLSVNEPGFKCELINVLSKLG